jgi:hypothetical protein
VETKVSLGKITCKPRVAHVGYVMDKVATKLVFSDNFALPLSVPLHLIPTFFIFHLGKDEELIKSLTSMRTISSLPPQYKQQTLNG